MKILIKFPKLSKLTNCQVPKHPKLKNFQNLQTGWLTKQIDSEFEFWQQLTSKLNFVMLFVTNRVASHCFNFSLKKVVNKWGVVLQNRSLIERGVNETEVITSS